MDTYASAELTALASEVRAALSPRRVAGGPQWKSQPRDADGQFTDMGGATKVASKLMELAKKPSKEVSLDEILEAAGHPASDLQTTRPQNGDFWSLRHKLETRDYYEAAEQAKWESKALLSYWYERNSGPIQLANPPQGREPTTSELDKAVDADSAWLGRLSEILREMHNAHLAASRGGRHAVHAFARGFYAT